MANSSPTIRHVEPHVDDADILGGSKSNDTASNASQMHRSTFKSICLVMACTLAMVANTSNSTTVAIALPTIERDLQIEQVQLKWVVSGYPLSSGCLLLMFGRLADLYGRKLLFSLGSIWLIALTLGCAFVHDDITLDVLRAFQGVGAAATIPASIGILAHAFPPSRARSIAFATFSAGAPVGGAMGMALGGVLTELTAQTWRSTFYLTTALTAFSLLVGLFSIDPDLPSTESDKRVDWLGAFLVTSGLVLIVFVLGQGESAPQKWATPYIIVLLILGVLLLVVFLIYQRYLEKVIDDPSNAGAKSSIWTPPPLMRPSLWGRAHGRVAVVMWIAFLNWCSFLGWNYWVQLYYQNFMHYTPVGTMIRLLPMFVTGLICNVLVAALVGHVPIIYLIGTGTALTSIASLLFALIDPNAVYWAFGFPAAVLSVIGADFVFAAGTIFIAKVSLPHEQSLAGALFQTMTQLGTSVGVTVSTVVFNRVIVQESAKYGITPDPSGHNAPRSVQLLSYKAAEWSTFAFGVLATLLAVIFFRGVGIVGHQEPEKSIPSEDMERTSSPSKRHENEKTPSQSIPT